MNKLIRNELLIQINSVTVDHSVAQKTHYAIVVFVIFLCLTILFVFCCSPTLRYYISFNLVMADYMFSGNGFVTSFLKQLGHLQALEQK